AGSDGTIVDVVQGSPAFTAGLGPGEKIVAVNDRALSDGQTQLDDALRAAQSSGTIRFLLTAGDVYSQKTITYRGGPRYPHLERIAGKPDVLGAIATPLGS
ncbi:MAG TPA: PDZ domain-containing protein, partial [Candidatus Acidoferrum sp.]|nr:PDZ domain-containing protein [Candidatus Acidoferrum sp.]